MKFAASLPRFTLSQILFAVFAWSLLILRFGYRFGTGDQVELLPYTLFLHDPSLYAHDFFIQGLHATVPNERTVMAHLLLPFVGQLEVWCFVFHLLATVVLVLGMERIATMFIRNRYMAWLSVLVTLIPLNDFTLGNVELYSDCLQASSVATAIVVWGLYYFLKRSYLLSSVLLSVATIIQVLEGLDVTMLLCAVLLIYILVRKEPVKNLLYFGGFYALTAGIFLVWIFIGKQEASPLSNEELFQILILFRHPHHFILATFPKLKLLVFMLLTGVALFYFYRHSLLLMGFVLFGLLGIGFYALAVDGFHNIFIANFQFYKVTQWIKFLGVVAVLGFAEAYIFKRWNELGWPRLEVPLLAGAVVLCWVVAVGYSQYLPYKVPFQLFGMKERDDMIAICSRIREVTPPDAVFIQPFDNTELKFYAQRSSYVEFKANVRHRKYVAKWYRRVQLVYGVSAQNHETGFTLQQKADESYYSSDPLRFNSFIGQGITHMLVERRYKPAFGTLILENNTYAVYKL